MPAANPYEEQLVARHLIDTVVANATGRAETECVRNQPRDKYFIGNLAPVPLEARARANSDGDRIEGGEDDAEQGGIPVELQSKLAPFSFGADLLANPDRGEVHVSVKLSWTLYYRVFPTFDQQSNWQQHRHEEVPSNQTELADEIDANAPPENRGRTPTESMFPRYKKIECSAAGVAVFSEDQCDSSQIDQSVQAELARAQQIVVGDPERIRTSGAIDQKIRVPETALVDEGTFDDFLRRQTSEVPPQWALGVELTTRLVSEENWMIGFEFTNLSQIRFDNPNLEGFFFDTGATMTFEQGCSLPIDIELVPRGFRYDRQMWGRGFNCALEKISDQDSYRTNHAPVYVQNRYQTRNQPEASFQSLIDTPSDVLNNVRSAMSAYMTTWEQFRQRYSSNFQDWEETFSTSFDQDLEVYRDEIRRFEIGQRLIENDPDLALAFELTNQTFASMPNRDAWRLFQLVFLVSQIPGIAALNPAYQEYSDEREKVDIVYFPTGGGKTEAYLSTIVFHCFYDRLRGKRGGVTAWTRFPLRLLTLQQTQRGADAIGLAELVRCNHPDARLSGSDVDGFGIGYFVGQGGSPNEITPPNDYNQNPAEWSIVRDSEQRQRFKRVVKCPSCATDSVRIDFDEQAICLQHRCTNQNCRFPDGLLPVYVVDNEIYRYLPSLVVGTIDKLAGLGNQRKISMLFGAVDGICPEHGYLKQRCCQKNCQANARWRSNVEVSGATLFVQDELHLLKEGLGTFDSHYESFSQRIRQEFGHSDTLKIIASSATIEAFQRQVEHLYARLPSDARCFPGLGPSLYESFYAETLDHPQRLFVGIIPHNKTILNAILELLEIYHREQMSMAQLPSGAPNPFGGGQVTASPDYDALTDLYKTSLTYFLSNRQLSEIQTDILGDVNGNLLGDGFAEIIPRELSGGTSTSDVTAILDHLETQLGRGESPDAVLATSMISHGVDIDRFNAMFFYGMPRLNAEYIQASSRVGRKHVGIVFDCFHPIRERDRSHYDYFVKFHEYLGQLVEPVAINRWSRFSVQRTVPGLFMGVLLQLIANRSTGNPNKFYMRDHVLQQITSGAINEGAVKQFLKSSYRVENPSNDAEQAFSDEIDRLVSLFFNQLRSSGSATFVSNVLNPTPMRSLRDVDEPVTIELDSFGTTWANNVTRR